MFNAQNSTIKRRRRHSPNRAPPVAVYTSLKIYSVVRSRNIIDHLIKLRLCISYHRLLCKRMRECYLQFKCFFPNILKIGLFIVMLKDNIDVNAKSNFVKSHFHGTSVSVVQWLCDDDHGTDFSEIELQDELTFPPKKLTLLPIEYSHVKHLLNKSSRPDGKLWDPRLSSNFSDIDNFMNIEMH